MTVELLYLKPDIQIEPLFDSWYAGTDLVPPALAARHLTERHLKILDCYLSAPSFHASVVRNPKWQGGPFVDCNAHRVGEIAALRERTIQSHADLIELSAAINALDAAVRRRQTDFSFEAQYARVPAILRGYVELVYDPRNMPSFRMIEPLLYRSPFYKRSAQSLSLSPSDGKDRPFALSTPRLESPESLRLTVPFEDEQVDFLSRLRRSPRPWASICDNLSASGEQHPLLRSFVTPDAPPPCPRYIGKGIRWRYFGHSCLLVETASSSIVFDPVLSHAVGGRVSPYTHQDLPARIDLLVVTRNHPDHVLLETLLQIRRSVNAIVVPRSLGGQLQDPSLKLLLHQAGCRNVVEWGSMESIDFEGGSLTALPVLGDHEDADSRSKLACAIRLGQRRLLFLPDCGNVEPSLYKPIRKEIGTIDAIFLGFEGGGIPPSWVCDPLSTRRLEHAIDTSRRLVSPNQDQAVRMAELCGCAEAYVYAIGRQPWMNHLMGIRSAETPCQVVVDACRERRIAAETLVGEKEILVSA